MNDGHIYSTHRLGGTLTDMIWRARHWSEKRRRQLLIPVHEIHHPDRRFAPPTRFMWLLGGAVLGFVVGATPSLLFGLAVGCKLCR